MNSTRLSRRLSACAFFNHVLTGALCFGVAAISASGQAPAGKGPSNTLRLRIPSVVRKAPDTTMPTLKFEKYTLPNGLDVILSEDHRLPLVAVNIWYHVGPANERAGRTGFAHLFEHMMFEGSKHVPGNAHIQYMEGAGATDVNGTTDFDRTNYFETVPANELELALWAESDRMGYLPDKLDQASLTNQQAVVRNERRQSVENSPYGIVEEGVFHNLFPQGHPYYADVMGSHADIQAAKLADIRDFFKLYYAPNNASLAIAGDFDPAQAKMLVEKYFGPLKRGAPVPKVNAATPPITAERRVVIQDHVELPRVYFGWVTSPIFKPGDADADLAANILGGGRSSRLYKKLVYDKQIALDVEAYQQSLVLGSVFAVVATARPGHTPEEIEMEMNAEIEALRKDGPTPAELERAQNVIETRMIQGLERLGGFGGVADRLNQYNHYLGTPDYLTQDLARYQNATIASVRAFSQEQLKPTARLVLYGIPGTPNLGPDVPTPAIEQKGQSTGGAAVNADAPWRATMPGAGPSRPLNLPVPQISTLANGLTLIYNYRPGLPLMAANLVFKAGSTSNPVAKPGLAAFTANMLLQGTAAHDATQIADETARLGAALNANATMDQTGVAAAALTKNFAGTLDLLSDIVLHPSFPADEVERRRAARVAGFASDRGNPQVIATRVGVAALFGPNSTLGYDNAGTENSVKSFTRDDLVNFWKTYYVPTDAALAVAGDMPFAQMKALVEQKFAAWKGENVALPQIAAPETTKSRFILVDRPGAQQTTVRVMQIGVGRATPDYAPLEVMNAELGGLFSSRINMNLREVHGYTYGTQSLFVYRRTQGYFLTQGAIRTDVTAPAIMEIFKEMGRMIDAPMTADELKLAKDSQSRSLPGLFETGRRTTDDLADIFVYGLPPDYYAKLPDRLSGVSTGDTEMVAKKYLHPDQMILVCVGDRAKIEPELRKLNLGAIEVRDADGKLIQ
jgi:zinc protease